MNAAVYFFGEFSDGYSQYPDDHTSGIFKKFHENAKATTQVVIHRDADLMYYGYIRKLDGNGYIGLCVVLNGLYLTQIDGLFSLYENSISNWIRKGWLIHFNERGEIVTDVEKLHRHKDEIELAAGMLRAGFNHLGSHAKVLPAVSYGLSKDSVKDFSVSDDKAEIIRSSYQNGYTCIYKSKEFNTAELDGYRSVLARVSGEKANLEKEISSLKTELQKTRRQKKQITNVFLLALVILGCAVGIYFLNENLAVTQNRLDNATDTIKSMKKEIENKDNKISSLEVSKDSLQLIYNHEQAKRQQLEIQIGKFCEHQPFIITSCNVSGTTFSFDYYAAEDSEMTVTLKAVDENNFEIESGDYDLTFDKGGGVHNLILENNFNRFNHYDIFLKYKGGIVAGKSL